MGVQTAMRATPNCGSLVLWIMDHRGFLKLRVLETSSECNSWWTLQETERSGEGAAKRTDIVKTISGTDGSGKHIDGRTNQTGVGKNMVIQHHGAAEGRDGMPTLLSHA